MSLSRSRQGIRNTERVPLLKLLLQESPEDGWRKGPSPCLCVHRWTKCCKITPRKVTLGAILLMEILTCVELSGTLRTSKKPGVEIWIQLCHFVSYVSLHEFLCISAPQIPYAYNKEIVKTDTMY